MGAGAGINNPAVYTLLSEISLVKFRGSLTVLNTLTANVAFVYALSLSAMFSYDYFVLFSLVPLSLFLLTSYFLPESPVWLIKRDRFDQAKRNLTWLRGCSYRGTKLELEEIQQCLEHSGQKLPFKAKLAYLGSRKVVRPMAIMSALFVLQVMNECYYIITLI